jgi:hypothetical protein
MPRWPLACHLALPSLFCLLLDAGWLSVGLHSFPLLMSTLSVEREVNVRPRCRLPRWNRRHSLSGRSVLRLRYGYGGGGRSPRAMPSGRGEVDPPFSVRSHVELLGGVSYHGPQWGQWPVVGWAHDGGIWTVPPGREPQAAEAVDDELEAPKANGFVEGEAILR